MVIDLRFIYSEAASDWQIRTHLDEPLILRLTVDLCGALAHTPIRVDPFFSPSPRIAPTTPTASRPSTAATISGSQRRQGASPLLPSFLGSDRRLRGAARRTGASLGSRTLLGSLRSC